MQGVDKYDRQLRLWGAFGQQRLMQSHILLIHADAAGCETLKNLILPGVGAVTIWDDKEVSHSDASNNFFTPVSTIGRSRAEVALEYLCALNPEVQGSFRHLTSLLSHDMSSLTSYSMVILSNAAPNTVLAYSAACAQSCIPLLILRSRGFYGSVQLQVEHHHVLDSKSEAIHFDLRINQPFPTLQTYVNQFDLSSQSDIEHYHTPFIVILLHLYKEWQSQHGAPITFQQKEAFKKFVLSRARDVNKADNYKEAVKYAYLAYQQPTHGLDEVQAILDAFADKTLSPASSHFEFLIKALSLYMQTHHDAPLMGSLPDMTASTDTYVTLQQIYADKATQDKMEFEKILTSLLMVCSALLTRCYYCQDVGSPNSVSDEVISMFCKNIRQLRLVSTSLASSAYDDGHLQLKMQEYCDDDYDDPAQTPRHAFLALLAAEKYALNRGETPVSSDIFYSFCSENVSEPLQPSREQCEEIFRYSNLEMHNISSVVGGVASQEAVKILTHQYVPINNVFVFNGIAGVAAAYEI